MIGLIRRGLYGLRGRGRYERLRALLAEQHLPEEELRERQFAKLRSVLHHAWLTVPWYRQRFGELGASPDDIRSFEDFAKLPLLTPPDIENYFPALLSESVPDS